MTNGEYWKDEILKISEQGNGFGLVDNKIVSCCRIFCNDCHFHNYEGACSAKYMPWLYAEHIEKPTLTKKERMFCELVETGFIARDEDGRIFYFKHMPVSVTSNITGRYWTSPDQDMTVDIHIIDCLQEGFKFIKGTDKEPWNVEELLKLAMEEKDN